MYGSVTVRTCDISVIEFVIWLSKYLSVGVYWFESNQPQRNLFFLYFDAFIIFCCKYLNLLMLEKETLSTKQYQISFNTYRQKELVKINFINCTCATNLK